MTVVAFKGESAPGEVNAELVAELESLLARAKAAEIAGMAFAVALPDGLMECGWTNCTQGRYGLAPGILALSHRYGAGMWE